MSSAEEEMRLDALAAAAGVATTTVRLYQQRGLLPGPRLVGRTGWYTKDHLARLRLIAKLQEQGFSLAGIGRLLQAAERGGDLNALAGVETELDSLGDRSEAVVVEPAELLRRFGSTAISADSMRRAAELGLVELTDDGRLRVPDRRFLDIGAALVHLGVSAEVVLEEWAALSAETDRIAERFVAVFEHQILGSDWRARLDGALAEQAAHALPTLLRLATQSVVTALDRSLAAAVDARLGDLVVTIETGTAQAPGDLQREE